MSSPCLDVDRINFTISNSRRESAFFYPDSLDHVTCRAHVCLLGLMSFEVEMNSWLPEGAIVWPLSPRRMRSGQIGEQTYPLPPPFPKKKVTLISERSGRATRTKEVVATRLRASIRPGPRLTWWPASYVRHWFVCFCWFTFGLTWSYFKAGLTPKFIVLLSPTAINENGDAAGSDALYPTCANRTSLFFFLQCMKQSTFNWHLFSKWSLDWEISHALLIHLCK